MTRSLDESNQISMTHFFWEGITYDFALDVLVDMRAVTWRMVILKMARRRRRFEPAISNNKKKQPRRMRD